MCAPPNSNLQMLYCWLRLCPAWRFFFYVFCYTIACMYRIWMEYENDLCWLRCVLCNCSWSCLCVPLCVVVVLPSTIQWWWSCSRCSSELVWGLGYNCTWTRLPGWHTLYVNLPFSHRLRWNFHAVEWRKDSYDVRYVAFTCLVALECSMCALFGCFGSLLDAAKLLPS